MELSPRRSPRATPPKWRKPSDIMRNHSLRVKGTALLNRIHQQDSLTSAFPYPVKRKNPFSSNSSKTGIKKAKDVEEEDSLLKILGFCEKSSSSSINEGEPSVSSSPQTVEPNLERLCELPVDWTLRTKMRFISSHPLPWNLPIKTCQEASGITGFVRCTDGRDTSAGGQFHQSSLVWLQPYLPWLQMFPTAKDRQSTSNLPNDPIIRESLRHDWANSFRSLFQLLRVRHCPYFYVVSGYWTCLFRSPGINRTSEVTALISPVTKSFCKLLADDGISYINPHLLASKKKCDEENGGDKDGTGEDGTEEDIAGEEVEEDQKDWLSSMGLLGVCKSPEAKGGNKKGKKEDTVIMVEGSNAQALVNFLINCKSVISNGGPRAGLPPSLLSPVAFPGATLTTLKVSESSVNVDGERFKSLEVRGPILPSSVLNFATILQQRLPAFSLTFANVESTKSFNLFQDSDAREETSGCVAFAEEALIDSGLCSRLIPTFCSGKTASYDSIRFDGGYLLS